MSIISILGGLVILGIFVAIIFFAAKKTNEKAKAAADALSEEEKNYLKNTPYQGAPSIGPNAVYAPAYVCTVTPRSTGGAALYLLFCNTYFPGSDGNFDPADINISKKEFEEHPVKAGDHVYIILNEDKGAKVAWDVQPQ